MRIGINLLYLIPTVVGGMEIYAASLLRALYALDTHNEYVVYVNQESTDFRPVEGKRWRYSQFSFSAQSRAKRYFWEQTVLPRQVAEDKVDVLHSLGYVGPIFATCRHVVTIPDLNYRTMKDTMSFSKRHALRFFSERSARRAEHVITLSEFSRQEILRNLKLDSERVTVTHLAGKEHLSPIAAPELTRIRDMYGLDAPYLVAFGGRAIHKNIPRLLEAFAMIAGQIDHKLVLIGTVPSNVSLPDDAIALGIDGRILTTGYVPDEHVPPLLAGADLYVLPSTYEGFGIPVLEAQEVGVPVVCSHAGSLPEIGGSGALYFDPLSVNEIADSLVKGLCDTVVRRELVANGTANLRRFSWRKAAETTMRVYDRVWQAPRKTQR